MNVFFGLPIPAQDAQKMTQLLIQQHPHWQNNRAIRWTADYNQHLTLHFFGSIDPQLLSGLISGLPEYIQSISSFSIKINKLHNFTKEDSKLIAAYVSLSSPLAKLYRQLEQAVKDYQFPVEERTFLPHITLCRSSRRHILTMESIIPPDDPIAISTLILYQTQSTTKGQEYVPLHQWRLADSE